MSAPTPAMTAEQWKARLAGDEMRESEGWDLDAEVAMYRAPFNRGEPDLCFVRWDDRGQRRGEPVQDPKAIAAICLYGMSYGFTQEDVDKLRWLIGWAATKQEYGGLEIDDADATPLLSLADRLAALLPPAP